MAEATIQITVRADLGQRLEALAVQRGQSVNEVLEALLPLSSPSLDGNWARAVAEGMASLDIEWRDEPDAVERSREHYEAHLREKWARQNSTKHEVPDGDSSG